MHYRYLGLPLALALLTTLGVGCDILGSDDDSDPKADEVIVVGTQVGNDFQETGEFGLSATPLDKKGNSILSENIDAEVDVQEVNSSSSTSIKSQSAKRQIEASVTVNRVNEPSGDPLAVSLNFDASGSLDRSDPDEIRKEGGKAFVDELESIQRDYEAAVFTYSGNCDPSSVPPFDCSTLLQDFTNDATALKDSIDLVGDSGNTPTYGSLLEVLGYSEAERSKSSYEKAIVLFSDGIPNDANLDARRDSVCNVEIPAKESPVFAIGLGAGNDHPDEPNTDPEAVREMNRLASCSSQGGAYIGVNPDPDSAEQSIRDRFSGFATATAQGSITFNVKITNGLDELETGDTVEGTLRVTSGGQTVEGTFQFRVPESTNSTEAFRYSRYK